MVANSSVSQSVRLFNILRTLFLVTVSAAQNKLKVWQEKVWVMLGSLPLMMVTVNVGPLGSLILVWMCGDRTPVITTACNLTGYGRRIITVNLASYNYNNFRNNTLSEMTFSRKRLSRPVLVLSGGPPERGKGWGHCVNGRKPPSI